MQLWHQLNKFFPKKCKKARLPSKNFGAGSGTRVTATLREQVSLRNHELLRGEEPPGQPWVLRQALSLCPALGQRGFSAQEEVGRELSTPANCSTKGTGKAQWRKLA